MSRTTTRGWYRVGLLLGVTLPGCFARVWEEGSELFPEPTTSEGSTGEGAAAPSTGTGAADTIDPVQTVTGGTSEATGEAASGPSATSSEEALPPAIEWLVATPEHVGEAGEVLLDAAVSANTARVRLALQGEPLAEVEPGALPHHYSVLSAKFNFVHEFSAVAVDAEGRTSAPATATVTVKVPASGAEKCLFVDETATSSAVAAVVHAGTSIVAVGTRDPGSGPRLTLWLLDPGSCAATVRTIANWTATPGLDNQMSGGTAVAIDGAGNLVVAGFTLEGLVPRRYLALLNAGGSLLWERQGAAGEEIAGVAVAPMPVGAVFAVGWRRSSEAPQPTDAAAWIYKLDGTASPPDYWAAPFVEGEEPDLFNTFSERLRAVVFEPGSGLAVAVGEREFKDKDMVIYSRTFLARIHPVTGRVGEPWTSPGVAFNHDAGLALSTCGDELVAAGWRRDLPGDDPQPVLQWFERDGTFTELQPIAVSSAQFAGVDCDREGKIVSAGVRDLGQTDAIAVATPRSGGAPTWYETGTSGEDEATAASCDGRGFCAWGGFRTEAGKRHAVVRVHHP